MSFPHWMGLGGLGGSGVFLSLGGGKCLAKDLYIPKCHPEGEVVVHSGQILNPQMISSVSSGWSGDSVLGFLDFRWWSKSLVYSSIGRVSIAAVPASTCWANSVVQVSLINDRRGSCVKTVPSACTKCVRCCWSTLFSNSVGS